MFVLPLNSHTCAVGTEVGLPSYFLTSPLESHSKSHRSPWGLYPLSGAEGTIAPNSLDSGPHWRGMGHFLSNLLKSFESVCSLGQSFHRQGADQ